MHHSGPIAGVAAQGPWVATAGYDNRLILWDAVTRLPVARSTHDHLVNACDFSHDGRYLVSASSDYSARIWSLPDLRLIAVLTGHDDDVDMARFSPDDSLVATCALDRVVRVFGADGVLRHAMQGHTGNILSLAWLDDHRFVTSSVDGTLRTWHADKGMCLGVDDLGMRSDCVEITRDGRIMAGDDLGRIAVVQGGTPIFVAGHQAGIKKLVIARDGQRMVTLGYDRMLAVWDVTAAIPRMVARSEIPPQVWARAAAVCPDGRIAVGSFGTTFGLFDPQTALWDMEGVSAGPAINAIIEQAGTILTIGDAGALQADGAFAGNVGSLCNFLCAAQGRVLTGGHLGEICDAASGAVLYRHHAPLNCATAFAMGGAPHVAIGAYTGEILLFEVGSDLTLVRVIHPYAHAVKSLASAGGLLFSVCANTDIAWHDPASGTEIRRVAHAHTRIANAACALADEGFASVGRDRMLRLWLNDCAPAFRTPHPNSVKCMAASPCGRWIASGSYGGTVALFDRATRSFLPMRRISKAGISALCWSETGGCFLAASYAGEVMPLPIPETLAQRAAA